MNQFRVVDSLPTILTVAMGALLLLVCAKFPVWGVILLERKLEVYPIVSRETVATLDEMSITLNDFGEACEAHQAYERDLYYVADCSDESISECVRRVDGASQRIEEATDKMYAAVAARKAIAARADWWLVKSMLIGGQAYTHSTWLCAPAFASFTTQINLGFTPTYDTSAS